MKIMKRFAIALLACLPVFGVGSVVQSIGPLGPPPVSGPDTRLYLLNLLWTGDSVNGSVPATVISITQFPQLQGMRIVSFEIQPGTPAPTTGYSLTLVDSTGIDLLAGAATNLSSSASSSNTTILSPPIVAAPTFNVSGNSVASARGQVNIYLAQQTQISATQGAPGLVAANAFTGANTFKNINRTRMVDFANASGWAGTDACAWINSAVADLAGAQGTVDARGLAAGTSTCTSGTISIPQNITLLLSGTISTNANPGISMPSATPSQGVAGGIFGTGRFNTVITCTANSADCVKIGDGVNIMRGFTLTELKISTTGTTANAIRVADGAIHVVGRNLQLNPTGSCVVFTPGTFGQQFQDWDSVRCDGYSGVGFNANLSTMTGGSNLQITNVYMNASGSTTGTIGFDIENWHAVTINSSDADANAGPTGTPTGFTLAGLSTSGSFTLNTVHCENTSTVCISITGVGSYTLTSPSGKNVGQLIDVNAVSAVAIINPWSFGTTGANDIIFETASAQGSYFLVGGLNLSKLVTATANAPFTVFGNTFNGSPNGPMMTMFGDQFNNSRGLGLTDTHAGGHAYNIGELFATGRLSLRDTTASGAISLTMPTSAVEGIMTASGITATRTYTLPDNSSGLPVSFSCGNTGSGNQTCAPAAASVKTQIYNGESTLAANAATITFPNTFTSVTSYFCIANDVTTRANPVQMVPASANTATITNTTGATDVIQWICAGQ